jgi:hypothetical protein
LNQRPQLKHQVFTLAHYTIGALLDVKQFSYLYYTVNHIYHFHHIFGTRHARDMIVRSLESYLLQLFNGILYKMPLWLNYKICDDFPYYSQYALYLALHTELWLSAEVKLGLTNKSLVKQCINGQYSFYCVT